MKFYLQQQNDEEFSLYNISFFTAFRKYTLLKATNTSKNVSDFLYNISMLVQIC